MAAAATAAASGLLGTLTFSPSASANDSFKLFSFPDSLQQSLREGASCVAAAGPGSYAAQQHPPPPSHPRPPPQAAARRH